MTISIPPVAAQAQRVPLRLAVVQLRPKIGQVNANIERARELCFKLEPHSIDLLCFPEMAFTGYVFDSAEAISPYLEEPRIGPSSLFCQEVAKHLGCYVAAGYPEKLSEEERQSDSRAQDGMHMEASSSPPENDAALVSQPNVSQPQPRTRTRTIVGANSAIIYGPTGEWVGGYRKTNLFETDMTWAKAGTGFKSFSLPLNVNPTPSDLDNSDSEHPPRPSLEMTLAICMDLNPQPPNDWTSASASAKGPFELADHCAKHQSRLLVMLNAWLYSDSDLNEDGDTTETRTRTRTAGSDHNDHEDVQDNAVEEEKDDGESHNDNEKSIDSDDDLDDPDWYTLRYWTARLEPLWRRDWRRRGSNETIMSGSSNMSDGEVEGDNNNNNLDAVEGDDQEEEEEEEKPPHETIVVVCNRTGKENGKIFAGSSAIFSMRAGSGRPKLLNMMGKDEVGVRVWNLLV